MPSFERAGDNLHCYWCSHSFKNDFYRITDFLGYQNVIRRYHIKCYKHCERRPPCLHHLVPEQRLYKLDEETRQDLLSLYPHVVWPLERRATLTLPKPIEELKNYELRLELAKRDRMRGHSRYMKKQDLVDNLREYIEQCSVLRIRSRDLAKGYCRRMEARKYGLNVPEYLKQIVVAYSGLNERADGRFVWWALDESFQNNAMIFLSR